MIRQGTWLGGSCSLHSLVSGMSPVSLFYGLSASTMLGLWMLFSVGLGMETHVPVVAFCSVHAPMQAALTSIAVHYVLRWLFAPVGSLHAPLHACWASCAARTASSPSATLCPSYLVSVLSTRM